MELDILLIGLILGGLAGAFFMAILHRKGLSISGPRKK